MAGKVTLAEKMLGFAENVIAGATGKEAKLAFEIGGKRLESNNSSLYKQARKVASKRARKVAGDLATKNGLQRGTKEFNNEFTRNYRNIMNQVTPYNFQRSAAGGKMGDFLGGGIRDSIKDYRKADAAFKAGTSKHEASVLTALQKGYTKQGGGLDMKKVAGTAVLGAGAGRIVTGGGLYRDRYGRVNVPIVPFI